MDRHKQILIDSAVKILDDEFFRVLGKGPKTIKKKKRGTK
jgi:hypothetical protein